MATPLAPPDDRQLSVFPELEWEAGWRLESRNFGFGGYSALVLREEGRLLAVSDRSEFLEFTPAANEENPAKFYRRYTSSQHEAHATDVEAVFEDRETGVMWAAFERRNLIMRFSAEGETTGHRYPRAMRDWPSNGGPEAMTRLMDGSFLIISERPRHLFTDAHPALVFEGDPVEDSAVREFEIKFGEGWRPVEAGVLPDGRVVFLLRAFQMGLPPRFNSALAVGSLKPSENGWSWSRDTFVDLAGLIPPENYEGLAIAHGEDGTAYLWLISDDNRSVFQQTFLIKLRWIEEEHEKARSNTARP